MVAVAAAAVIVANVALLGVVEGRDEPVGKLRPGIALTPAGDSTTAPTTAAATSPATTAPEAQTVPAETRPGETATPGGSPGEEGEKPEDADD